MNFENERNLRMRKPLKLTHTLEKTCFTSTCKQNNKSISLLPNQLSVKLDQELNDSHLRVSKYTRLKLFTLLIQSLNQHRHCHTKHHRL